jgi:two-component system, OmpR family, sensor histidine kinase CiaH
VSVAAAGGHDVRRSSIRVALAATAFVALVYLLVAVAVVAIFTQSQVQQIDAQLTRGFGPQSGGQNGGGQYAGPAPEHPGAQPIALWRVDDDGDAEPDARNDFTAIPASYGAITTPRTITVDGVDVRVAGARAPDGDYIVLGQSLQPLDQSRSTIVRAEILIAPVLLGLVFLGAVAIGRRVAAPIERSRRRQLEFTADASHELRTPLSVIEAHTSLALQQDRSAAWYRTAFERVDRESKRMHRLVDDLLWLARFDATQGAPTSEPVDLPALAAQAVDRFGVVAETRRLRLGVESSGGGLVVAAPPEWLDRLLGVLIDNACKYSPDGGAVAIRIASQGGRVTLSVDDAGPGIPPAERDRIFDRFHRATDATAGAGLGLAIADAIVRATHGRWSVAESPLGGARMSVSWPAAFAGPKAAGDRSGSNDERELSPTRQVSPDSGSNHRKIAGP